MNSARSMFGEFNQLRGTTVHLEETRSMMRVHWEQKTCFTDGSFFFFSKFRVENWFYKFTHQKFSILDFDFEKKEKEIER